MRRADPDPAARHALVKAATRLMLTRGFTATSVNEICREAGQTKGSLFHYFATKEDLGAAVLDAYLAQVFGKLDEVRANQVEPLGRVFASLDFLAAASGAYPLREGCILGRFTQELAQTHPRFREKCSAYFDRWIAFMADDFQAARRGLGRNEARSLAQYAVAAFEGALILAKASGDAAVVRTTIAHTRDHLARVFGPSMPA